MLRLVVASCLLGALGCARAHDLGVDPGSTSTTSTTTGSGAGGSGGSTGSTSSGSGGSGGVVDPEPTGPTRLTIVNGINDYDSIRLCFLPNEAVWPPSPLAFGEARVVDPIASAIPAGADVALWVVAGDLAQIDGKTCSQITMLGPPADAGPAVLVAPLAVIPAATFLAEKSLVMVPAGCLGGPGHSDPGAALGCGTSYTQDTPTATVVLGALSRIKNPARVSLQIVDAAPAMPTGDVRVLPSILMANESTVASSIALGAIAPKPPFADLALGDYGPLDKAMVETYLSGTTKTSSLALADVIAGSAFPLSVFADGAGFALVARGAYPGTAGGPFWHKFGYTLIKSDP